MCRGAETPLPARTRIRSPSCRSQNRSAAAASAGGTASSTRTAVSTSRPESSLRTSEAPESWVWLKYSETRPRSTTSSPTVGAYPPISVVNEPMKTNSPSEVSGSPSSVPSRLWR